MAVIKSYETMSAVAVVDDIVVSVTILAGTLAGLLSTLKIMELTSAWQPGNRRAKPQSARGVWPVEHHRLLGFLHAPQTLIPTSLPRSPPEARVHDGLDDTSRPPSLSLAFDPCVLVSPTPSARSSAPHA